MFEAVEVLEGGEPVVDVDQLVFGVVEDLVKIFEICNNFFADFGVDVAKKTVNAEVRGEYLRLALAGVCHHWLWFVDKRVLVLAELYFLYLSVNFLGLKHLVDQL